MIIERIGLNNTYNLWTENWEGGKLEEEETNFFLMLD